MMDLRHGRTKLVVDSRTGSIARIEDAVSGLVHIDANRDGRQDGRLFQLVLPSEAWWSCPAESQVQPIVRCQRQGNGLVIEYPDLKAADGAQTGVAVRVEIRPGAADEFLLTMHVDNRGPRTVIDTTFPLLGGWHEQGGGDKDRIARGANAFIHPNQYPNASGNNYARNAQRGGKHYPVDLACPWVDVSGPTGGLSYVNYMTEGRNGKFWIENLAGYGTDFRLMMGWAHLIALRPGQSWTSPTMGLAVHAGDWRQTADRYRAWFGKLHAPDYSRPAVRSRIGFQNVFFRGFDGTPIRPLDALPAAAAAGRRYGVDLLAVWDTLSLGNYARHDPHDLMDYSAGERALLQRGLGQAEAAGTRTCALINFRHPNVGLHLPDPDLLNQVQRRYVGTFRTENWTVNHTFEDLWVQHIGPESYIFSPFSPAHRERVRRLTRSYLELGYSSMFYDQPFEHHPDYGFIDKGFPPDATQHEALQVIREVRQLLLARDPQAVVIGEESDIHATPYVDQWMSWSIAGPTPALIERVAMLRYSMPHTMLSWVMDHEPERAAIAFAMGMQFCLMVHGAEGTLDDEPAFAARVGALAALRRATAARTVMARFIGQTGLQIDGESAFSAWAYDSPEGPAVIAAACGAPARGKVTVSLDEFMGSVQGASGRVLGTGGAQSAHAGLTREFALGLNDVAVWLL
ncbi:MAG: hypothetical protein K8T26_17355 [Lentisphaerae bacterium]|nr:hypothetical protein [Lentisphaerota bacterium]